jgi:hypothetical protein
MILTETSVDLIFFKKCGAGFLVLMKCLKRNEKRHSTVDNCISSLDMKLMGQSGTESTSFVSVSSVGSCKVRGFSTTDRIRDDMFRQIFDVTLPKVDNEYQLQAGVKKWNMSMQLEAERAQDLVREAEDISVQQQVMEEDPEAFGGSTTLDSSSKMVKSGSKTRMMAPSSVEEGVTATEEDIIDGETAEENVGSIAMLSVKRARMSGGAADGGTMELEQALIAAKVSVEEAVFAKTSMEQELTAAKTSMEQELITAKTELNGMRTSFEQELLVSKNQTNEAIKKLEAYKTTSNCLIASERRRADASQLAKETYEKEMNARVEAETKTSLQQTEPSEVTKLQSMLTDAEAVAGPLMAKVRQQDGAIFNMQRESERMRDELRLLKQRRSFTYGGMPGEFEEDPVEEVGPSEFDKMKWDLSMTKDALEGALHYQKGFMAQIASLNASIDTRVKEAVNVEKISGEANLKIQAAKCNKWMQDQSNKYTLALKDVQTDAKKYTVQLEAELERVLSAKEDVDDLLTIERMRNARLSASVNPGVAAAPKKVTVEAGTTTQPDTGSIETMMAAVAVADDSTMSVMAHQRLISSERLRYTNEARCRVETTRLLELERERVLALEKKMEDGIEVISGGVVKEAKTKAAEAEKKAKQQTERAVRAEQEVKQVKDELEKRVEGAKAMMGDVYQAYEQESKAKRALNFQFLKAQRLREVALIQVAKAEDAERFAQLEVENLKEKIKQGPIAADLADLLKALEEAEQNFKHEAAVRRDVEAKFAHLRVVVDTQKSKIMQLKESLGEVERRAESMSAAMRSGPFRFGGW